MGINMNLPCLIAALVLLSNPMINLFDFLPDFIAWFLLMRAISKTTYLSGKLAESSSNMLKLFWLTLAKAVSLVLVPQIDGTMVLTVTLVFDVLETIFVLSAFTGLFDGISEISELYDLRAAFAVRGKSKREHIKIAQSATVFFVAVKYITNVLPEFLELSGQSSTITPEGARNLLSFKPLVYVVCFVIMLIAAIVWLCVIIPFFKAVTTESEFVSKVDAAFDVKAIKTGIYRAKVISGAMFMMTAAGLFMFSIIFDSVDLVPTFIMPIVVLFALKKLAGQGYSSRLAAVFTAGSAAVSVAAYVIKTLFATKYSYEAVKLSFEAYDSYLVAVSAVICEAVMLFVSYILVARLVNAVVRSISGKSSDAALEKIDSDEIRGLSRKITVSCVLFGAAAVFSVLSFALAGDYPIIWMPALFVDLVWFVQLCSASSAVRTYVDDSILYRVS